MRTASWKLRKKGILKGHCTSPNDLRSSFLVETLSSLLWYTFSWLFVRSVGWSDFCFNLCSYSAFFAGSFLCWASKFQNGSNINLGLSSSLSVFPKLPNSVPQVNDILYVDDPQSDISKICFSWEALICVFNVLLICKDIYVYFSNSVPSTFHSNPQTCSSSNPLHLSEWQQT